MFTIGLDILVENFQITVLRKKRLGVIYNFEFTYSGIYLDIYSGIQYLTITTSKSFFLNFVIMKKFS